MLCVGQVSCHANVNFYVNDYLIKKIKVIKISHTHSNGILEVKIAMPDNTLIIKNIIYCTFKP